MTSPADDGEGSLRQAIVLANENPGLDQIAFAIGTGPGSIRVLSALPAITDPVELDASTQPGFAGSPLIEIDGSALSDDHPGLILAAGSSSIRGLVINRFGGAGLVVVSNGGNVLRGNYFGTDPSGTIALGNGYEGVYFVDVSDNVIGGPGPGDGNLISGNTHGLILNGGARNTIQGNRVGTDVTGSFALGNTYHGIFFYNASDNLIGGAGPGEGNLVSGNGENGIRIQGWSSLNNRILGNQVGTDASGTAAIGNRNSGVALADNPYMAGGNRIGGAQPGEGNLISGNHRHGVEMLALGGGGYVIAANVQGNRIGTDVTGAASIGNQASGLYLQDCVTVRVGGEFPGDGNLISGNGASGIEINGGWGVSVYGNRIGTDRDGAIALGNASDGVSVYGRAYATRIGGASDVDPGAGGNLISGNGGHGVSVSESDAVIARNRIGTEDSGRHSLGNHLDGVLVQNNAYTSSAVVSNLISGNALHGIEVRDSFVFAKENLIGTDVDVSLAVGNGLDGIHLAAGATGSIEDNIIGGNGGSGVAFAPGSRGAVYGGSIGTDREGLASLGNGGPGVAVRYASQVEIGRAFLPFYSYNQLTRIAHNGVATGGAGVEVSGGALGLRIGGLWLRGNLGGDVTLEGIEDAAATPGIASVTAHDDGLAVMGSITGDPGATHLLQAYATPPDGSESMPLGSALIVVGANGRRDFDAFFPGRVAVGWTIVLTSQVGQGSTSLPSSPLRIRPNAGLSLKLTEAPGVVVAGSPREYTLTLANEGPDDATDVRAEIRLPNGLGLDPNFAVVGPWRIAADMLIYDQGDLAARGTTSASFRLMAQEPGTRTLTAVIRGDVSDPEPGDDTATVTTRFADRPGRIQFLSAVAEGSEAARVLYIDLERVGGTGGALSAILSSSQGTDEIAFSRTVSFADGQSRLVVSVPLTDDTVYRGDRRIEFRLSGGAVGTVATLTATIRDDDPEPGPPAPDPLPPPADPVPILGPPTITPPEVRLASSTPIVRRGKVVGVLLTFTGALDPTRAGESARYVLTLPGRDRKLGTRDDIRRKVRSAFYSEAGRSVTLAWSGGSSFAAGTRALVGWDSTSPARIVDGLGRAIGGESNASIAPPAGSWGEFGALRRQRR